MKFFTKRNNVQKTIIVFVILILFNFIVPNYSHADVGGILLSPIVSLVAALLDGFNGIMQYMMIRRK